MKSGWQGLLRFQVQPPGFCPGRRRGPGAAVPPPRPARAQALQYGLITPHPAAFYRSMDQGLVQCQLCPRNCEVLPGDRGECGVRENREGKYYSLVYGNPCAVHLDPIEKKPLFHILPASLSFSIATAGCNLHCKFCQNWEISQTRPEKTYNFDLPPEKVVAAARDNHCRSIAHTYVEPIIFYEYMRDVARLAKPPGSSTSAIRRATSIPNPWKNWRAPGRRLH